MSRDFRKASILMRRPECWRSSGTLPWLDEPKTVVTWAKGPEILAYCTDDLGIWCRYSLNFFFKVAGGEMVEQPPYK
jgi:hypothetical protein